MSCWCACMEKSARWFSVFVSGNKNSRQDEWKLMFYNKTVDQATAHQHLKTCRRYAICGRKVICMIIIMELWLQWQLLDYNKWSFSNRWQTCMFSNIDVLLFGQQFCCKTSTSIHPVLNSCFHLQICWSIMVPSPYTHTNNSRISSTIYFSVVKKQITLNNSGWMYVHTERSMFIKLISYVALLHSTIHHQILTVCSQTQTLNYLRFVSIHALQ